jgi:hypothetical protein
MTSGSICEIIDSLRSLGGFHVVRRVFWSLLGDEVGDAREGSQRRCPVGSALLRGQAFLNGGLM